MSEQRSYILRLIAPSYFSGFVSVLLSVSVIAVVLTPFLYKGSYLERYGEVVRLYPGGWGDTYAKIGSQLNTNELVGNIVIFCAWAIVGLAVYSLILAFLSLFINAVTFANLLGFKNTDKKTLIMQTFEKLAVRIFGVVCLALFLVFVFQYLVPLVLTLVAAAFSSPPLIGSLYVLAAGVFLSAALHVVVVLLRTIFLRVRVVSWMYDTSDL